MATNSGAQVVKYVGDDLVQVLFEGDTYLLNLDEAASIGANVFTYQGKPISFASFARIMNKSPKTILYMVHEYNYTTGEEIIQHYQDSEQKLLPYQGRRISVAQFAREINRNLMSIHRMIKKYGYTTGEEIVEHYEKLAEKQYTYQGRLIKLKELEPITGRKSSAMSAIAVAKGFTTGEQIIEYYKKVDDDQITYKGEPITIKALADIIGIGAGNLRGFIDRNKLRTGEEVIAYLKELEEKGRIDYAGKRITIKEFANSIGKNNSQVYFALRKGCKTGEDVVKYFEEADKRATRISYQGKIDAIDDVARALGKSKNTVMTLARKYGYTTGEEIIEHYKNIGKITYNGKPMTISEFSKLTGITEAAARGLTNKYKYTTGEEVIEHYRKLNESKPLTYQGKRFSYSDFARLVGEDVARVMWAVEKYGYKTGEEIIEYWNKANAQKSVFTYQGKAITNREFAKLIGKGDSTIDYIKHKYGFTTGEQIIEYYNNLNAREKFTYQGKEISIRQFSILMGKGSDSSILEIVKREGFTTGEQVIEYYAQLKPKRAPITLEGKVISLAKFSKLIGISRPSIADVIDKYGFTTGEQVIAHYRSVGKL